MPELKVFLSNFSKKSNSTKLPPADVTQIEFTGVLREGTSVLAPVIGFDFGAGGTQINMFGTHGATYAVITETFFRSYFINNWTYQDGLWWASMTVDVLGTYRANIGAMSAYILRASNALAWNLNAKDGTYPAVGGTNYSYQYVLNPWYDPTTATQPGYLIGVMNNDESITMQRGGVKYYLMSDAEMRALISYMMGDVNYLNISAEDVSESVAKILLNPSQYIVSIKWFPDYTFLFNQLASGNKIDFNFGWWTLTGVKNSTTKNNVTRLTKNWIISVPKHPMAATYKYTQLEPYSHYILHIPPWGDIGIDSSLLYDLDSISVSVHIDPTLTYAELEIQSTDGNYHPMARYEGTIGVEVPLTTIQTQGDVTKQLELALGQAGSQILNSSGMQRFAAGARETAAEIMSKATSIGSFGLLNQPAEAFSSRMISATELGSTVLDSVMSGQINASSSGCVDASMVYYDNGYLRLDYLDMAATSDATFGRPSLQFKQISEIPGYIQTANPHFAVPTATDSENAAIVRYMQGGFWYE